MKRRMTFQILNLFLGFATLATSLFAQNLNPVVTVTLKDLDTLAKNLPDITAKTGDVQGSLVAGMVNGFLTQEKITEAIDTQRPVGFFLGKLENDELFAVTVLPVKDIEKALNLVPPSFKKEAVGENYWTLKNEPKDTDSRPTTIINVYGKNDWCFLSYTPIDEVKNSDGAKFIDLLNKEATTHDIGVSVFVNAIPQNDREKIFNELVKEANEKLEKSKCPIACKHKEHIKAHLEALCKSAKKHNYESPVSNISLGYTWDANANNLYITNTFSGSQNKITKRIVAGTQENDSAIANFATNGSLASGQLNAVIPELECIANCICEKVKKKAGEQCIENVTLLTSAFMNPSVERAGAVFAGENGFTLVGACAVPDGYALEAKFVDACKYAKEKKAEKFEKRIRDGKRCEDGDLHIYQANTVPHHPLPKKLQCLFKETVPTTIIFAPKAIYVAWGSDATAVLKKCIAENAQVADAPVTSVRLSMKQAITVATLCGKIDSELSEKLMKLDDADVTIQINDVENGAQSVTVIPVAILKATVIARNYEANKK